MYWNFNEVQHRYGDRQPLQYQREQFLPKFIPSLTWGEFPKFTYYLPAKAIENAIAWIHAKNQKIPENLSSKLEQIWKEEANARN